MPSKLQEGTYCDLFNNTILSLRNNRNNCNRNDINGLFCHNYQTNI